MQGANLARFPSIVEPAATRPRLWRQTGAPDAVAGCAFNQAGLHRRGALAVEDGLDETGSLVTQPLKRIGHNAATRHAPSVIDRPRARRRAGRITSGPH